MDTKVNYTVVGAFVLILTTAIIVAIIWLSSGLTVESYSNYTVYMQESVTGLSVDGTVEYNGVTVGSVREINLNQHNPHLVELLLKIKSNTPITEGTEAMLATKGITGVAFVALKDKGTDLTPLKTIPGQKYPVIRTAPSLFLRIDTALEKLTNSISKVSKSLQQLLDADNLHSIKETLKNLDAITASLASESQSFKIFINNTSQASKQLPYTMQSITTQTLPGMNSVLTNMDTLTDELKENPSILIRGSAEPPLGPGEN